MNSKVESFIWLPWFNDEFWTTNGVCRLILIEYFLTPRKFEPQIAGF